MDTDAPRAETATHGPPAHWSVGGLLMESVARRDFEAMADCLETGVRLRALLPPGLMEVTGRDEVVDWFRCVFDGADALELVDGTVGEIGSRLYLRWRVSLTSGGPDRSQAVVEQHVFATAGEQIASLDLLCSGFVPEATPLRNSQGKDPCQTGQ